MHAKTSRGEAAETNLDFGILWAQSMIRSASAKLWLSVFNSCWRNGVKSLGRIDSRIPLNCRLLRLHLSSRSATMFLSQVSSVAWESKVSTTSLWDIAISSILISVCWILLFCSAMEWLMMLKIEPNSLDIVCFRANSMFFITISVAWGVSSREVFYCGNVVFFLLEGNEHIGSFLRRDRSSMLMRFFQGCTV